MQVVWSRLRNQWTIGAVACVVLAGVLVTWSLSSAGDRMGVVRTARAIHSGEVFSEADFATAEVAVDASVEGLVPADRLQRLVGRVAAVDLPEGVLVQRGAWRTTAALMAGERAVGVVLKPGRVPSSVQQGDTVQVASIDVATPSVDPSVNGGTAVTVAPFTSVPRSVVLARVVACTTRDDGTVVLELAVADAVAVQVAQWAANDLLVVVLVPHSALVGDGSGAGSSVPPTSAEVAP